MFKRRRDQDARTWPLLALLLLVVLVAAGCVLWFLREAMRNERIAMRETLAEAYRGHLSLLQARLTEEWNRDLAGMDGPEPAAARFARCAREGLAESAICLDDAGRAAYPGEVAAGAAGESDEAAALQEQVRALAHAGDAKALARFVLEEFPASDVTADGEGRLISANAELLALEKIGNRNDADFQQIAGRLSDRIEDYQTGAMPAAQRRFLMHALRRLDPGREFPLLAAENLAGQFVDAKATIVREAGLHATELPGVWSAVSPGGGTLGLFTTAGLKTGLGEMIRDPSLPAGARLAIEAPGDNAANEPALAATPAGAELPGWRLALFIDDETLFDTEAAQRVKFLVLVACVVIAAISALAIFIGRSFGRQVRLARLKNDLVATVSHELKTPLTAMRALVDTLIDTERLDEKTTREYLQLIATENARLSRLIENFLTFSRLERNKFAFDLKPVRPEAIVEAAVAAFGERAHAPDCTLESSIEGNLPPIRGDLDALTTALLNLLDNAWKYSEGDRRIRVGARLHDGSVSFDVADNGIGLSPRESRRVFRRFYQSDQRLARTAGGCGLGLSIVQSIVETHRGAVRVMSEPGLGSTFTMEIPAMAGGTA